MIFPEVNLINVTMKSCVGTTETYFQSFFQIIKQRKRETRRRKNVSDKTPQHHIHVILKKNHSITSCHLEVHVISRHLVVPAKEMKRQRPNAKKTESFVQHSKNKRKKGRLIGVGVPFEGL
jgi:hypothetical protein